MLGRRCYTDLCKIGFARWLLLCIVFFGCALLFLSLASSPRLANSKDIRSLARLRLAGNSSDAGSSGWDITHVQSLFFHTEERPFPKLANEAPKKINVCRHREFTDLDSDPTLSAVLDKFYAKLSSRHKKVINAHDFKYIHNVPNACVGRKIELLIGVPTRTNSFDARQSIRESWGQYAKEPPYNAVVLFFLGSQKNPTEQEKVDAEAIKYGDIVQEDFEDTYRNLSIKTVALMKWVSLYCPDSTFTLKADDDMYINMPRLLAKLQQQHERGPVFILGALHHNTFPFRDQNNKWGVTKEEYPGKIYPNYVSGTAYAMTTSAAMRLYIESLYVKILFLEDVYLTGLVADQAGVPRVADDDFSWAKYEPDGCKFRDKISGHKNSPEEIRKIHKELYDPNLRCIESKK
ncbi:beta-1,3-galactosyltransferase 1-like [Physella acuta]|uniref:beta-1,3-galactosyltransferase 1-like n=1 Tax=Physella acuta TaxID=109671 RepID=UPI0027DE9A1B|nr:beta-1,3-galactosyltransferase 1-like [Physella acuta]